MAAVALSSAGRVWKYDAPPLNSFFTWRGNTIHSNGGFGLGVDGFITPGAAASVRAEPGAAPAQPRMAEVLLEHNEVRMSTVPFAKGPGVAGLLLRGNSFDGGS